MRLPEEIKNQTNPSIYVFNHIMLSKIRLNKLTRKQNRNNIRKSCLFTYLGSNQENIEINI